MAKKAKGKKKELSEDEIKIKKQIKQLREEKEKKKNQDQARIDLENKLREEEKISITNKLEIHNKWRNIMRAEKTQELTRDVETFAESHERLSERNNSAIKRLGTTILEIEQQTQLAINSHLVNLTRLEELYEERTSSIRSEFESELESLEQDYMKLREEMIAKNEEEKEREMDILRAMEYEFNVKDNEYKQSFQNQRDEIQSKSMEDLSNLNLKLNARIRSLEKSFDQSYQTYVTQTENRISKLDQNTYQDEQNTKAIELNNRKLQRLHRNLNHWRTKMANNVKDCDSRNKSLKEEKDAVGAHFQTMKARMAKFRDKQSVKLADLANNSNVTIKSMDAKIRKAEKILTLGEMNLKLETEKEKIVPFYSETQLTEEEATEYSMMLKDQEQIVQQLMKTKIEENETNYNQDPRQPYNTIILTNENKPVSEWEYLRNFYKRYNKVHLDKVALEHEKFKLLQENNDLQTILKQYLDGISVNNDVMNRPNPLFIVNGKTAPTIRVNGVGSNQPTTLVINSMTPQR